MAHALEHLEDNRLVRPRSRYVGATGRTWTPVEDRSGDSAGSRVGGTDPPDPA